MYIPKQFDEPRVEALHALIESHPLGSLVTMTGGGLEANHLPFELDPEPAPYGTLRGHVARANPVWQTYSSEVEALVIFQGAGEYITPSWYLSKREHGKVVPTWNYAVVHAYGALRVVEDRAWLRGLVERLTGRHEAGRAAPWAVTDAPADFVESMLGAIVGVEIPLARLHGKWKVSQNRPAKDRESVVEGLTAERRESATRMADLVRRAATDGS
ncbi:MAG: FMN-binding negative transcriptional regulator [Gammaproteobacteria bacterium]|nr:FMN-binding negative transcriptional regulator [Gammaproteobacteria bacterium]